MPFAKGVVHLVMDRRKRAILPVAEKHADRIEGKTQHAWHGQQADRPAIGSDAGGAHVGFDLEAQRFARTRPIIAVMKGEQVEAVAREQAQLARQSVNLVKIKQRHEDAIAQAMRPLARASVPHLAKI